MERFNHAVILIGIYILEYFLVQKIFGKKRFKRIYDRGGFLILILFSFLFYVVISPSVLDFCLVF